MAVENSITEAIFRIFTELKMIQNVTNASSMHENIVAKCFVFGRTMKVRRPEICAFCIFHTDYRREPKIAQEYQVGNTKNNE